MLTEMTNKGGGMLKVNSMTFTQSLKLSTPVMFLKQFN